MANKRVVIVGGVAGGASCAARLRRLDESAEIMLVERGPYVSFANCGLPYYVGEIIRDESRLLLASPELLKQRFNIDVRVEHEATVIDREQRRVTMRDKQGVTVREPYDALVLATGAQPIRPPLPGIHLPGIFTLRTIPDSRAIRAWIKARNARRAVVVGGGFIGLEMAENLQQRELSVTIVELAQHVLPPLDAEMAALVHERLRSHGVALQLGDGVKAFHAGAEQALVVETQAGARFDADLVILAIGARPDVALARQAGIEIGALGGVRVDEQMRTSDPDIWAVGDMVEVRDRVSGAWLLVPLAGPANRQGRVAADAIAGRASAFHGVQGTAVCGVFGLTVAMTGATEKALRRAGREDFERLYLHPNHHVGYYPGARSIAIKVLFAKEDGRILGAQAVGEEGVDKRIDLLAFAIQKAATIHDLAEVELSYAPQYGAAKDPLNLVGMMADNVAQGDVALARWEDVAATDALLVDVREPAECAAGPIPRAINIPLSMLRRRYEELPRERELWLSCQSGQHSYVACRFLAQQGFRVRNLPGGYKTYRQFFPG
ncbi:MAG: FAD-dependent oxidoreductase [Vicinamibacteria bacterium]|jgi:NADPH-dependent 2,4-dienoyl-CoA reductase/sulfur reductase-like enzyme/rhodanese-related sulfurtransferase|nr:FAD-dependent oxidoreductase [Vicinamibacteria bacterium]